MSSGSLLFRRLRLFRRPGVPASERALPGATRVSLLGTMFVLTLLPLSLAPLPLSGQQDPLEQGPGFRNEDGEEEEEAGWRGDLDFGFTLTEGNTETTSLSGGGSATWGFDRSRVRMDGRYLRSTDDGEETANKGNLAVQYDYFPTEHFFLFVRQFTSFDEAAGLDLRLAPSGGLGYQLLRRERVEMTVQGGGSFVRDEFTDGSSTEDFGLAVLETFYLRLAEDTHFEHSLSYQPKTADFGDYLLETEASLSTMITSALGLKVSLRDEFDAEPFEDPVTGEVRRKNDITFVTGVTFRF